MSEWIPFLQTLIWPLFLALFLIFSRRYVASILSTIAQRIEGGDPFQAGPTGISLGASERKLTQLDEAPSTDNEVDAMIIKKDKGEEKQDVSFANQPTQYQKVIYLIHSASAPRIDTDGVERRGISVIVDADSEDILDKVERVVYHLHPSFPNPDRETTDRQRRFILNTRAWGEFNLSADVYLQGYENPVTIYRYINFRSY